MNNNEKIFLRLLIAVIFITFCMVAYQGFYCNFTTIC